MAQARPAKPKAPAYGKQVAGSLLVAVLIVVLTIFAVTAAIGPGTDTRDLRDLQRIEEDRREARADKAGG